jgi:transposase-like protein
LGISNKSLHAWIKQYGEPLDMETARQKELAARIRQPERQLAMREGQIEVLKKAIGIVSQDEQTVHDDPARTGQRWVERGRIV